MHNFEPIAFSECDSCGELLQLNDHGLCKLCHEESEIFKQAAGAAKMRDYDPFKAGMLAQAAAVKLCDTQEELCRK